MTENMLHNLRHQSLGELLSLQARAIPDKAWLLSGERRVTFSEAEAIANRIANALICFGLKKSETVSVMATTSIEVVLYAMGVFKAGGVFMPVDPELKGELLKDSLERSNARYLIVFEGFENRVKKIELPKRIREVFVSDNRGTDFRLLSELSDGMSELAPDVHPGPADPAIIIQSSGTTGRSKLVLYTHNVNVFHAVDSVNYDYQDDEVTYICTPPMPRLPWISGVFPSLVAGTKLALDAHFSASKYWDRIRHYGATRSILVGALPQYVWEQPEREDDKDNPLRIAFYTPISSEMAIRFKKRFGIQTIDQCYGCCETGPIFYARDKGDVPWETGAIGDPVPYFDIQLVDENDEPIAPGQVGEVCVRPKLPHIMFEEYYGDSEYTLKTFRNLWFHLGDMLLLTEDGRYFFAGRKKDYIRYKGKNISLYEVDTVACKHPDVYEAVSFGCGLDENSEEKLGLAVVLKKGSSCTEEDIARFINDNAPYYHVPYGIGFVDYLPHNVSARIERYKVKESCKIENFWKWDDTGFKPSK